MIGRCSWCESVKLVTKNIQAVVEGFDSLSAHCEVVMPRREKHHPVAPEPEAQAQVPVKHERPYGVICYWEYREPQRRDDKCWFLVESYGIDMDGYPTTKVENTGDLDSRHEYTNWVSKKEPYDPPHEDDYELGPIPGRAVTVWTTSGVDLMAFNPPGEPAKWLAYDFGEKLKKLERWWDLLENGHTLYMGTQRRVEDLMDAGWDFSKVG